MANDVRSPNDPSVTTLVTGIVGDVQELIKQQIALVRVEVRDDFQKTKSAISSLAIGGGILLLGIILACLMVVYALNAAWPELPLWACYAIVGGVLLALGAGLLYAGKRKFDTFNPLPDQSYQALKENLQWQKTK
jgi:uncharacterized membrane protein YqjE